MIVLCRRGGRALPVAGLSSRTLRRPPLRRRAMVPRRQQRGETTASSPKRCRSFARPREEKGDGPGAPFPRPPGGFGNVSGCWRPPRGRGEERSRRGLGNIPKQMPRRRGWLRISGYFLYRAEKREPAGDTGKDIALRHPKSSSRAAASPGFAPRAAFLHPKPNRRGTRHQKSSVTGSRASFLGTE